MKNKVKYLDSHTGGEPTRVILEGGPDLGSGPLSERAETLRLHFDEFRRSVIEEPRGWDALVGALLCEPHDPSCEVGVLFFNNVGYLGMCGHGTIGLAVTLKSIGAVKPGIFRLETTVGVVEVELLDDHRVAVRNVPSHRYREGVNLRVEGYGTLQGDIAWGGNWFFLVKQSPLPLERKRIRELTELSLGIRTALGEEGITGEGGALIDHIELCGPPSTEVADGKNFVLCPGGAFDRSPCGTGTSAKLACLAADGILKPGDTWVQESIVGSLFEASYESCEESSILPTIVGSAYETARGELLFAEQDPFAEGFPEDL
jgi:4-hydroxyproline epimerase